MRQHEKPSCSPYGKSIVHGTGEKASGALIASPVHVIKNGIFHSSILGEMHMAFRTLWHYLFVGRRGPKLGFYDVSRSPFRVWPTDIDLLLHMNNGKYLSVMDIARFDMIQRSGVLDLFQREGWYTVIVGQTISYRKSLKPGQKYWVESRVLGFDEKAA